eukprot:191387-Pelagomonas_calceolata.AAC.4
MLVANKQLQKLFGYKKTEMEGKNVSMMMPQPFSQRHNGYLRNYVSTGEGSAVCGGLEMGGRRALAKTRGH